MMKQHTPFRKYARVGACWASRTHGPLGRIHTTISALPGRKNSSSFNGTRILNQSTYQRIPYGPRPFVVNPVSTLMTLMMCAPHSNNSLIHLTSAAYLHPSNVQGWAILSETHYFGSFHYIVNTGFSSNP